jgi:2'-5' RNA ligase
VPEQTALIAVVPEAEPVVGRHRAALDRVASWGVPAHITVLFPFLPPEHVDGQVLAALGDIFAAHPAYEIVLSRVAWFGTDVVWLAPSPDDAFRQRAAVRRRVRRRDPAPDRRPPRPAPDAAGRGR